MTIDSHQHFWKYHPDTHSWIDDSMKLLRRDFLPEELTPLLRLHHVDGCVAVQADQSEKETDFLLECAAKNPVIKGVVGWLDLCADDIEERLRKYSKYQMLKGLRHIVQDEPDVNFMLRPEFLRGISLLEEYGLTYDILIYPKQLPAALSLVQKFPEQAFVLDHLAKPVIDGSVDDTWQSYIRKLGEKPNVYCKVSGMVTETTWGEWQKEDFTAYLDVVFEAFGPERIMYGSDWPVCLLSGQYGEVLNIVQEYLSKFPVEVRRQVMGLNAISFYKLRVE